MKKVLTLMAVLSAVGLAQAAPLPALNDATFWSLLTALSEPSGEFPDDNYVSNELGLVRVIPDLEAYTAGRIDSVCALVAQSR